MIIQIVFIDYFESQKCEFHESLILFLIEWGKGIEPGFRWLSSYFSGMVFNESYHLIKGRRLSAVG